MADVRMLHLGSSVLLSGVNAFHEPQECGAWGEGSRRGQEGAGSAQPGAPTLLSLPGTNWLAGQHHGHLWPCEGRTCPLAPCLSVLAAGTAPPGTASCYF